MFSEAQYGQDFQRALEEASLFGNAVVAIRGHADARPARRRASWRPAKKRRTAQSDSRDGTPTPSPPTASRCDLEQHPVMSSTLVEEEPEAQVRRRRRATRPLSEVVEGLQDAVRRAGRHGARSILAYAKSKGLVLDESQIRTQGVGVQEPVFAYPQTDEQEAKNRRVEFSIIKVPADKVKADEFGL